MAKIKSHYTVQGTYRATVQKGNQSVEVECMHGQNVRLKGDPSLREALQDHLKPFSHRARHYTKGAYTGCDPTCAVEVMVGVEDFAFADDVKVVLHEEPRIFGEQRKRPLPEGWLYMKG